MDMGKLIEAAVKHKASDIHLMEEAPPSFRMDGILQPVKHPPVTHEHMLDVLKSLVPRRLQEVLEQKRGVDVGYQHKDMVRCRVIAFFERHRLRVVMRLIPMKPPTIEELDLPKILETIAEFPRGMVVVTGPTGSGKSTTLGAMIDHVNSTKKISITTIEDPIEYVHPNKKAMVSQREVGDDIEDYNSGLIQALRQDPDVILVGEMRETETVRTAIKAAETGHLVFSTLHTTTAVHTIERIIAVFPEPEQDLVREQLANNLKAVITQNLVRRKEGGGRIAALEIMVVTDMISKLIAENRMGDVWGVMKGGSEGMQTFDQALAAMVKEEKINEEDGALFCRDIHAYRRYIRGVSSSSDRGGIISGFA